MNLKDEFSVDTKLIADGIFSCLSYAMLKRLIASPIGLLMLIDLRASTFSSFSLQHLPQNGNMSMCTERHTTDKTAIKSHRE